MMTRAEHARQSARAVPPFVSLSQDEVVLALGITVQTLRRLERTAVADVAAARAT